MYNVVTFLPICDVNSEIQIKWIKNHPKDKNPSTISIYCYRTKV